MKIVHRNDIEHTSRMRDAALRRLRSTNRWLIAGAALLTGVLTDVAANAFPGHKVAVAKSTAKSAKASHVRHRPLKPPATAPRTTTSQAPQSTAPSEAPAPVQSEAPPAEETAAPSQQAAPESAPAPAQAPAPQAREEAPAPEPSEPVVSGGS